MSTTQEQTPDRADLRLGQTIRHRAGVHTLSDLQDVARMAKQSTLVQRLVRKTQNGTLGQETKEPEDEDMGNYNVGDTYNISNPQPASPSPTQSGITATQLIAGLSTMAALALGGYQLYQGLKPSPQTPGQVIPNDDTDTRYSVEFGD